MSYIYSNQLSSLTVDSFPITEEAEVPTVSTKLEESVDFEKGYYYGFYVYL